MLIPCAKCGKPVDDNGASWPGDDGEICQECWEAECSRHWWAYVLGEDDSNEGSLNASHY